jgi:hypothetical protein
MVETRARRLIAARNSQGTIRKNSFAVNQMSEQFFNRQFAFGISKLAFFSEIEAKRFSTYVNCFRIAKTK